MRNSSRHSRRYVASMAAVLGTASIIIAAYTSNVMMLLYIIPTVALLVPGYLASVWAAVRLSTEQTYAVRVARFVSPVVATYLAVVAVQFAVKALPLAVDLDTNPLDPTHGLTFLASLGAAIFGVWEAMSGAPTATPRPTPTTPPVG